MNRYTNFYKTLHTYLTSGLTVPKAVKVLNKDFPELGKIPNIDSMPLSVIMNVTNVFPESDIAIVEAGEASGYLDQILLELARHHEEAEKTRKQILRGFTIPAIHWTAFCFITPVPAFFVGDMTLASYLMKVLIPLVLGPFAIFLVYIIIKKSPLLYSIPIVGSIVRYKEKLKFFTALSLCLKSAIAITKSLQISLRTVNHPSLQKKITATMNTFEQHKCAFSVAAEQNELLNEEERAFILTGEETGSLAESLQFCANRNNEKLNLKLSFLAKVVPFIIYLIVAIIIVMSIVEQYKGYIDQLGG